MVILAPDEVVTIGTKSWRVPVTRRDLVKAISGVENDNIRWRLLETLDASDGLDIAVRDTDGDVLLERLADLEREDDNGTA